MRNKAILLGAILFGFVSVFSYAQNPVPFVNLPLLPDATAPAGPQFTLTVNGTGFVTNSVVNWNGNLLPTQFVSASQLTATVSSANIATAGTAWVSVVSPAPGGGTSNTTFFTVTANIGNSIGFNLTSSSTVGQSPYAVAMGDFNGDGKLDLAVANHCGNDSTCSSGAGTVSILLGDGKGNFNLSTSLAVGLDLWPTTMVTGDFNGDGKLDLAVASCSSQHCVSGLGAVAIFLGDGTGNFALGSSPAAGEWPWAAVAGDFNGDGNLDLAVGNMGDGTISILLGDGTGHFTPGPSFGVNGNPYSVAIGDFNGDGKLDLAVANFSGNGVSIFLGDGTGNFVRGAMPPAGVDSMSVAVGDFNGDGILDLVVANQCGSDPVCSGQGSVSILLGDGTGNFTSTPLLPAPCYLATVAVADFNGDGLLDVVLGCEGTTAIVMLGDGKGNFTAVSSPLAGLDPYSIVVGDFNNDGMLDFAAADLGANTVSIVLQTPQVPVAQLSAASLNFGVQPVGSSSAQTISVKNTGGAPLNISSISTSSSFTETNTCGSSLAAGAQCSLLVTFTSHTRGPITGALTLIDNAADSPQVVQLSGVGTVVSLSPSSLTFGTQSLGTVSTPQTVTLTNSSRQPVHLIGEHISGTNTGAFTDTNNCGAIVAAEASCTFNVTFAPKQRGANSAMLNITDDGGGGPQKVALAGTGK
jgi:hypothetical protein